MNLRNKNNSTYKAPLRRIFVEYVRVCRQKQKKNIFINSHDVVET